MNSLHLLKLLMVLLRTSRGGGVHCRTSSGVRGIHLSALVLPCHGYGGICESLSCPVTLWRPSVNPRPALSRLWRPSESSSCPVTAMEAVCESSSCPVTAMEAVCESSSCPVTAMEAVRILVLPSHGYGGSPNPRPAQPRLWRPSESSSCPVTAMEAV